MLIHAAVIFRSRKTTTVKLFSYHIAAGTSEFVFYYPDSVSFSYTTHRENTKWTGIITKIELVVLELVVILKLWCCSCCYCCCYNFTSILLYSMLYSAIFVAWQGMASNKTVWRADSINWQIGKCQALYSQFRFPSIYYQIKLFLDDFLLLVIALTDTRFLHIFSLSLVCLCGIFSPKLKSIQLIISLRIHWKLQLQMK